MSADIPNPQSGLSPYGSHDQIGSANELTQAGVRAAACLVREGTVVDLGQTLDPSSPHGAAPRSFKLILLAHGSLPASEQASHENKLTYFEEHSEHGYHVGTHLDGLAHVGRDGWFYNQNHYSEIYTPDGLQRLGAENIPPFVTRGVLLDITAAVGVDVLPVDFEIDRPMIEEAARRQHVEFRSGDALLLHTGWSQHWAADPATYASGEPGITPDTALWLRTMRPSVVGADNWAFEIVPSLDPERPFLAHQHLITDAGIYILENITTRALRDTGRSEFMFVMTPLLIRGATGSMVRPIAII